jgi:biopolymer transport protein ExbD
MRASTWRPTAKLRKRRANYLSLLDASGVAAVFFFLVGMYLVRTTPDCDLCSVRSVDYPAVTHARPMPGALREDAITVVATRDGSIYFGNRRIVPQNLPGLIEKAIQQGAERRVYLKADARVKYADVKAVLDQIRYSGVQDIVFLAEEAHSANP